MAQKSKTPGFWDLALKGWLGSSTTKQPAKGPLTTLHLLGPKSSFPKSCPAWVKKDLEEQKRDTATWTDEQGLHFAVAPEHNQSAPTPGDLPSSRFGLYRDATGKVVSDIMDRNPTQVLVINHGLKDDRIQGALTGLEMAHYRYINTRKKTKPPHLFLKDCEKADVQKANHLGVAVNAARHLVNLPPAELNPKSYADGVKTLVAGTGWTVTIWDEKKLRAEKCGLMIGVGQGATEGPRLVHMRYRPQGAKGKPLAIVGKGITFDAGGLDIKPAAGMRLMKKDMGGSASVVGTALWAKLSGIKRPLDFYLACAENSVDAKSFHPGDVLTARNGLTVEIHNTDAEGRLVLGDALDVAQSQKGKEAPAAIIDLATLTGAMRVALGLKVAGFFANDTGLATAMTKAGSSMSEPVWQMPLVGEYDALLKSGFADLSNAASVPFGGAITAALFLQRFIKDVPWLHVDMMAWADRREAAWSEAGGNGQLVQALAHLLSHYE